VWRSNTLIQPADTELLPARSRFLRLMSAHLDERAAIQLFDLFNVIAVLRYEEIENSGTLALCAPDAPLPPMLVRFEAPFQLKQVRGVRKYLHITDEDLCLVSDCRSAWGLTTRNQLNGEMLTVEFRPDGVWELRRGGDPLLRVEAPPACMPDRAVDRDRLARELRRTLPPLSETQIGRLCDLAGAAARQAHGTNMLISADAAREARRLASQCTLVEPVPFMPMLMERCTSIDGTVIIDTDGVCYAIGAILDGDVSERGDRTRGGRYNSALMYLDTVAAPSVIVVVSRDGTVDIVSSSGKHGLG
jgi:hypothetical protein